MLKRIIVASLLAASSLAQAENLVGKLLVLNPKGSQSGSVEIQPEQVNGILAGLMGFSGVSTVELPSTDSHANFLLVLDGAPLSTIQADSFSPSLSFDIKSSIQEAGSDLISRMISGKASDEEAEFSNLGDLLCQYHDNSAVFSISTHPNLGQAALPHDELSRNHPQWNIFGGDFDLQRSKAFVNGDKFLGAQKMVEGLFPMVKMGPNSESSSLFIREELALSRFLQSLEESEFASLLKDDSPDSITFISSSLTQIRKQYGGSSPQYLNAWSGFVSLIPKIHEQFLQAFGSDATFEVLFVESEAPVTINRSRRSAQKRDFTSIASNCFDTLEICQNSTSSCSGNGECQLAKQKADLSASCYRCKCSSDYAGESCEFINIVAPFHIIFWVSLAILISLALVCYSLAYMDPGTDTLLFRTSSKPKRE